MNFSRLYYSSQVLQDGRVFIAGAEYGNGTTNAEVYTPTSDSWMIIPVPDGLINKNNTIDPANGNNTAGFMDSGSKMIADGNVLIFPVEPFMDGETVLFNPFSNTLLQGPNLFRGSDEDEASCVKLADGSVLLVDRPPRVGSPSPGSSRFIPASKTFINDSTCTVSLYDPFGMEMGPAFLLPNGKAIFFGATSHTAIYTPSGNNSFGSWVPGPDFPDGQGMPDAPGAMMVDGKILVATSPTPTSANHFPSPISYYEYDFTSGPIGSFTRQSAPTGGLTYFPPTDATFAHRMLALPNGQVLYATEGFQLYVYTPSGPPLVAGKPTIQSVSQNADRTLHLTGTLFNGISEGAAYGDDAQMDSNYPLVRLTDTGGHVRYARTFNWSSTGVQTGATPATTEVALPDHLLPGMYSLSVVANGISSDPVPYDEPVWVDFNLACFGCGDGSFSDPFNTVQRARQHVPPADIIEFMAGSSGFCPEANCPCDPLAPRDCFPITFTETVTLKAFNGPVVIGQ
jgi:hypothetical protein